MPRKGENIYKRKDGRWEGRYIRKKTEDGKVRYGYVYAQTYSEVKKKLKASVLKAQKNVADFEQEQGNRKITLETAAMSWLDSIRPGIKESTAIKYYNTLHSYILPYLGEISLEQLSYSVLTAYTNRMLTQGGNCGTGLSPKTVSDIVTILRGIIRQAARNGKTVSFDIFSVQVRVSNTEIRVLSREEQEQLCAYLVENPSLLNLGILTCLFTGLRLGEICALRWEDVSLEEKTIYVHQTLLRLQMEKPDEKKTHIVISSPKSYNSIRVIPLPEKLLETIRLYENSQQGYFLTGNEHHAVDPRTMQKHFKRVLRACQIKDANFHALRHTFATRCVELGFDVKSLSELLGHANVNITMNRYVHPTMTMKRENMERLSELFAVR